MKLKQTAPATRRWNAMLLLAVGLFLYDLYQLKGLRKQIAEDYQAELEGLRHAPGVTLMHSRGSAP